MRTQTLLFGSSLPADNWSAALLHTVYLHNCLVHSETKKIPFEGYYGIKPDFVFLKLFGSHVCVKRTGNHCSKIDQHDFRVIFLRHASTDQNILYLDLDTGLVKCSHDAQLNEAWYLQPTCLPAAQLLYDLGLDADDNSHITVDTTDSAKEIHIQVLRAPWPPLPPHKLSESKWCVPPLSCTTPLPLCKTELPQPIGGVAAQVRSLPDATP